jgi:hypothetical protein
MKEKYWNKEEVYKMQEKLHDIEARKEDLVLCGIETSNNQCNDNS